MVQREPQNAATARAACQPFANPWILFDLKACGWDLDDLEPCLF